MNGFLQLFCMFSNCFWKKRTTSCSVVCFRWTNTNFKYLRVQNRKILLCVHGMLLIVHNSIICLLYPIAINIQFKRQIIFLLNKEVLFNKKIYQNWYSVGAFLLLLNGHDYTDYGFCWILSLFIIFSDSSFKIRLNTIKSRKTKKKFCSVATKSILSPYIKTTFF